MRGGFVRRMAMFFVVAAVLSVVAATFLFWTLASALGAPDLPGDIARGVALLIVLLGIGLAARSLRRLAAPVGGVIDARGPGAEGDLPAPAEEPGPREARALAPACNPVTAL